jgi:mannose-6-phosphate isomerase-like protein (cupin superfamily)
MARVKKRSERDLHHQARGWGHEVWIENIPEYCGKILLVDPSKRGSLHFHRVKKETMFVESGQARIRFIDTDTAQEYFVDLEPGDSVLIEPGQPHQIINPNPHQTLRLFEFSTEHHEEDSRRIQKGD